MYMPPQFNSQDRAIAAALMRQHPFASLISTDDEGLHFVTHLPLVLDRTRGAYGTLQGHIARANPHHELAGESSEALVLFTGSASVASLA